MPLIDAFASSPAFFAGACFVVGLLVGSFLNVVIHRLPIMLERRWRADCAELAGTAKTAAPEKREPAFNLVVPRSACPACHALIRASQNIPVASYLVLRGRCASCGAAISARYPLVELLTGLMSAAVAWKFGFGVGAAAALVLTWFLIALTFIDIDRQLLPDDLTLPLLWLGVLLSLAAGTNAETVPVDLRSSVGGAIAGYVSLWCVYHLFRLATGKEGMGYGDFKLLGALGAWLGWQMLLPIVLAAAAVGAVVGALQISLQGRDRATPVAFGPYLAAAGWLMLMFGHEIVHRYLGLFVGTPVKAKVYRVGLTGGVASGKSTVSKIFRGFGVPIIDTDELARDVVEPGQPPLERLVERFGTQILTADGHLDRPALRTIVFSDPKARADLEALTHPAIGAAAEARSAAAGGPYQIFVIPLLVEKNLKSHMDRVLLIDCDEDLQVRRLQERDRATPDEARAILNAQASRKARREVADDVITNDGALSALQPQVAVLHARYLELAGAAPA